MTHKKMARLARELQNGLAAIPQAELYAMQARVPTLDADGDIGDAVRELNKLCHDINRHGLCNADQGASHE